jgi:hypothetical protein
VTDRQRDQEEHSAMNKKPTSPTTKAPTKSKTAVRKVTVRDLEPRKDAEIKGGPLSGRQRCF